MNILFDFANLLVCIIIVLIAYKYTIIPRWIAFVLILQSFIPYFLNDFFFPASYMSDQFRYFNMVHELRSFNFNYVESYKVSIPAWFWTLLPLPFIETIKSLGFYNKFIFIILFIWLYRKRFLSGISLNFILFYPSLALYTSLSLRDPLIMTLMIVSIILFIDKKYFISFLISIPLLYIKFQNFFLILVFFGLFTIYNKKSFFYRLRYLLLIILMLSIVLFLDDIINTLNYYRGAMFREDGGNMTSLLEIENIYDLITIGVSSVSYFLFKPFPWEVNNLFQLIQSFENIIVFMILFIFTYRAYRQSSLLTLKWLSFILFSLLVYSLVVFNFGTAARYKFTFIVIYIVGLSYDLFKLKGYRFGNIFK